jgi:hypothetical protein
MKKRAIITVAVFLSVAYIAGGIALCYYVVMLNYLRLPDDMIEKILYKKVPIGTSMNEAIEIIESNQWVIEPTRGSGYGLLPNGQVLHNMTPSVCSQSKEVTLGHYWLGAVYVIAHFGFDDDGNLVNITVYKERMLLLF